MIISKIRPPPPVRPLCAVFTSATRSTRIMSYRPDVVPRWSQKTGNVFSTYKTLIQGVGTPWLAIVSQYLNQNVWFALAGWLAERVDGHPLYGYTPRPYTTNYMYSKSGPCNYM